MTNREPSGAGDSRRLIIRGLSCNLTAVRSDLARNGVRPLTRTLPSVGQTASRRDEVSPSVTVVPSWQSRLARLCLFRTYDLFTDGVSVGEWLHVGPAEHSSYLAVPDGGTGAGVLVLHAWWGLTSVFTDVCDRLAMDGYVALAPSLFPGGATAATIAEARELLAMHDEAAVAEPVVPAAVERLCGLPAVTGAQIGVIGFSMGAYWALHLSQARPDDVSTVVVVYGTDDGDYRSARATYLGHFAEQDDFEPLEAVRSLETKIREAGREVTFHVYPGTGHWFVEPNRPNVYNAAAAELVWERTLAFLKARLA